ncbi:MAG: dockerin type I repeat-containing protein [Ruminococcus sp.]|nr:dockerin type I repeat-containing protein [Ruminococcus sp.]
MKKIKVCMAFLLTIMLVLSSTIVSYAYDGEAASVIIEGSIIADEDDTVDLSGIKIDVYKYVLVYSDEYSSQYNRIFDSTVYTDSDGSFSFARPSETFFVSADPNSLPVGYGANGLFFSIPPQFSTVSFKITRIDSFEHDFFYPTSSLATTFYGKNGEVLNKVPDYSLIYDSQQLKEAFLSDGVVNLKCDFGDFSIEKQMPTDELSMFSKILWLYENNLITEEEEIKYLVINLNNNKINSHMDVPDAYNRIGIYLKSHEISDELKPYIDSIGRYNQVEIATYIFDNYYNNEIGEAVNESYCGDEFDDYPDSLDYYLIHFDSANAEEKPYYNRFGDKDEYFEYSEKTNKLYESGFAIIYGNPYNTKNTDKFKSLPELYEINPGTVEYMLRNYNHDGSSEIMNQHCWGKVGDADGDFEISISDATEIQKHLADLTTLEGANLKAADIGNKGAPSISDATMIQYYLASLVDKL